MGKILHLITPNQKIKLELITEAVNYYINELSTVNTNTDKIIELKRIIIEIEAMYRNTKLKEIYE
jgi:hypothetical protein